MDHHSLLSLKEGWTISPKKRENVPLLAEMLHPEKVKEKPFLKMHETIIRTRELF
jgi:hypothetical protein